MFGWLKEYGESNPQTKYFTLNALVYGLAIVITTAYCYGRLDFVRSYRSPHMDENLKQLEAIEDKPEVKK
jgi:hypothetical protein